MASAGQFVVQDDGTIGLSSGGASKVFTTGGACDECCTEPTCAGDGVACAFCSTTPSEFYTLTFSGVTLCTACKPDGFGASTKFSWAAGDVLNTSHSVEQNLITTCVWNRLTLVNAVSQTNYTDATCTTVDFVRDCDMFITLTKIDSTTWSVYVSIDAITDTDMFYAEKTVAADDCDTSFSVLNEQDGVVFDCFDPGPEPFGSGVAATGGSVTVVCQ